MQQLLGWLADAFNWCVSSGPLVDFYAKELRGNLFNGFLTIAAFLLSVKTFIIILLQEKVYGTDDYRQQIIEQREINKDLTIYGPLRRLSRLLNWTVIATLGTAISQLTVGLLNARIATIACLLFSVACVGLLFFIVWVMSFAMKDYFDQLEKRHGK